MKPLELGLVDGRTSQVDLEELGVAFAFLLEKLDLFVGISADHADDRSDVVVQASVEAMFTGNVAECEKDVWALLEDRRGNLLVESFCATASDPSPGVRARVRDSVLEGEGKVKRRVRADARIGNGFVAASCELSGESNRHRRSLTTEPVLEDSGRLAVITRVKRPEDLSVLERDNGLISWRTGVRTGEKDVISSRFLGHGGSILCERRIDHDASAATLPLSLRSKC